MTDAKRLLILGSTGSIGTQALEVCRHSGDFELVGLSAERSWEDLVEQARAHGVSRIALADEHAAAQAAEAWTDGEVLDGAEGLVRMVVESEADLVLNALVVVCVHRRRTYRKRADTAGPPRRAFATTAPRQHIPRRMRHP